MAPNISVSAMRLMLRAANEFTLDLFSWARGRLDFTDALILTVLIQRSASVVAGDVALQRAYAVFDTPPPEGLRRSISINAIAASLGLPFETARRRVHQLVEDGLCEIVPDGVRISSAHLASPGHRAALERGYDFTRAFYERLKRANCLPPVALQRTSDALLHLEAPPVRIVARAVADYMLRTMELVLPNFSTPATGFVVLAIVRVNTRHMSDDMRGRDFFGADAHVSDRLRRPAKTSEIADLLGLPYETARRHIALLLEDGRCRRVGRGVIVPVTSLVVDNVRNAFSANLVNLNRMMAMLADTGVLALWDAAAQTTSPPPQALTVR